MYQFYNPNLKDNPPLNKIGHIKMYRWYTGQGLMECKLAVEKLMDDGKLVSPEVNDKAFRSELHFGQRVRHFFIGVYTGSVEGYVPQAHHNPEKVVVNLDDGRQMTFYRSDLIPE